MPRFPVLCTAIAISVSTTFLGIQGRVARADDDGSNAWTELGDPGQALHAPALHAKGRREPLPMRRPIQGYATRVSGLAGSQLTLKVSTTASRFRVLALRIGWYHGRTQRLVWRSRWHRGVEQRRPIFKPLATRTVVAPWRPSVRTDTAGWRPGLYLIKLVTPRGVASFVPYVVRSPSSRGRVALVMPVATWQSYNDWGGYSLYHGPSGDRRSYAVSYDRPYPAPGAGSRKNLDGARQIVVRAERLHIHLAYMTNVDLEQSPRVLAGARAYVSVSHDEYWSRAMRHQVSEARRHGTNLAIFGANTMYWRIRLEDRATGKNRLQVGYRPSAAIDPVAQRHPRLTTARWRDRPFPQPENALHGLQYECFPVDVPYRVVSPGWWGFRGAHVRNGSTFPHLVGVEADRVYPIPSTPRPLQILSHVRYSCRGVTTSTQSVYLTLPSGAAVFNAGTLRWSCAMTGRCPPYDIASRTRRFVATVTDNVLRRFAQRRVGSRSPAHDNVRSFHLPRVNQVSAS